jgi:hypothetical protein
MKLKPIALKYLSTPATTVPCERLFSLAGSVISRKRASLKPCNVEKLVCMTSWRSKKSMKNSVGLNYDCDD